MLNLKLITEKLVPNRITVKENRAKPNQNRCDDDHRMIHLVCRG